MTERISVDNTELEFRQYSSPQTVSIYDGAVEVWHGTVNEFANAVQKLKAPDEKLYRVNGGSATKALIAIGVIEEVKFPLST